jgi:hypothetical protein
MTRKSKILFFIPFVIVVSLLLYSWFILLTNIYAEIHITHYLGLLLFVPVLYFLYIDKSLKKPLLALGIYLVLAIFCIVNIFPYVMRSKITLVLFGFDIPLPRMNGLALLLFILYFILNLGNLMEMHLDYKESKRKL